MRKAGIKKPPAPRTTAPASAKQQSARSPKTSSGGRARPRPLRFRSPSDSLCSVRRSMTDIAFFIAFIVGAAGLIWLARAARSLLEQRFGSMEDKLDRRLGDVETKVDRRLDGLDGRLLLQQQ